MNATTEMLQQSFGYPYVEKLNGFIFMFLCMMCWVNCAFLRAHFCIFLTNAKYMYFQWSKVKKKIFFEVGIFKQGDVHEANVSKGI